MSVKSDNLRIWDALGKTDPKHTKQFTRAGGFKGTAIKPMWANKQMTEFFGPAGIGWGMEKPEFQVVTTADEILVFCTAAIWYRESGSKSSERHFALGVGGDKVVSQVFLKDSQGNKVRGEDGKFKTYPQTDDEAFKKAYTDALSNAMKFIGVGADVHMGQFEDNKYVQAVGREFDEAKKAEVNAEIDRQKAGNKSQSYPTLDPSEAHVAPPELDWSYNKSSGVLICRIVDVAKGVTKAGKDYLTLTVNNELDKGKKPLLYYWHATHRDALLAAKGKIVKLLVIAKEKGFTVDAVMEIDHVKVRLDDKEADTSTQETGTTTGSRAGGNSIATDPEMTQAFSQAELQSRVLASVLGFEDEHLRELHAMNKHKWDDVLEALKVRKAEVEAGIEAGAR